MYSRKEIVELLIAKGADVNTKGVDDNTPLHSAAKFERKEIVELLIAKGADVNEKQKRYGSPTALDLAIKYKNTKIADLLRKHGGKTKNELEAKSK